MRLFRKSPSALLPVLTTVLAVGVAACGGGATSSDVAAKVGDVDITVAEVDEAYARRTAAGDGASEAPGAAGRGAEAAVLTTLIRSEILRQAAQERDVDVTEQELAEQRELLEEQLGGEEALNAAIEQANLSDEELETNLRDQVIQNEIVGQLADDVGDQAVRDAYDDDPQGRYGAKVAVRHILTERRNQALRAIERIEGGEDFADVASDLSIDPGSAQNGGDLGEIGRGETVPAFERAAFDADAGELVGPVKTDFGFHVLEVTEKVAAPEFAAVEDQIRTDLEAQSGGPAFTEFITGFIADLAIEVDDRYGRWDEASVAVVPPDQASEAPPSSSPVPAPSEQAS